MLAPTSRRPRRRRRSLVVAAGPPERALERRRSTLSWRQRRSVTISASIRSAGSDGGAAGVNWGSIISISMGESVPF